METADAMWKPDSTSSPSSLGRIMNTLLSSRPRHLEAAISRIGFAPSSRSGSAGILDDSLCYMRRHAKEAVEKGEPLDHILVPMIEHLLISKGSKHCKLVLILMNWLFEDNLVYEALASNIATLVVTKEDHYVRFGWCTLICSLVNFTINRSPEEGKRCDALVLKDALADPYKPSFTLRVQCGVLQVVDALMGEFELPTRLSIVAADCTLLLIEALTKTAILRRKSLDPMSENQLGMLPANFQKECDLGQRTSQGLEDMEMERWLWDHLDGIIILVEKLQAWSRKSQPLHAKGLGLLLMSLQEIKQHIHNLQFEAGGNMLKSGTLLCFCWRHYACLMRLEHNKFSQKIREMLEEYISAIQYYTQNENNNNVGENYSSIETRKFFLNCLCLLLGCLDRKKLEVVITERGPQLLNLLFSQLRYGDECLMEGSLSILRVLILKGNCSSGSSLLNTAEMDVALPLLLSFLDVRDSIAKAVVLLFAEYCSVNSYGKGLREIFRRVEFGDLSQKKNAVDVISELIRICSALDVRQDIAKHLLKCLGDEDLMSYVEESNLLPRFDPQFVLPALLPLVFSGNEKVQSSASNAITAVLKCHSQESSVILTFLDCLSVLGGNPNVAQTPGAMRKDVRCSSVQLQSASSGICIKDDDCISSLLVNRAFSLVEFEDVRKLAGELCGRLHPKVLFPIIESQLRHATQDHDILKMKICLFAICTSLVARDRDSAFHPAMPRIRKIFEMVLLWPSFDADEGIIMLAQVFVHRSDDWFTTGSQLVLTMILCFKNCFMFDIVFSKVQHGCIDCLALMICAEVKAPETSKDFPRNRISISQDANCPGERTSTISSVLAYVIQRLTSDEIYNISVESNKSTCHEGTFLIDMSRETSPATSDLSTVSTPIPLCLCMANVLIRACQKVSSSGNGLFACKVLPSVICSVQAIACSDVRAACLEVLFSAVYHLKYSVVPFSSDLFNLSVKALKKGSEKEKLAATKLMASLMASEDEIIASISGPLLEAKSVLEKAAIKASSPELQQLCKKLLACLTSID